MKYTVLYKGKELLEPIGEYESSAEIFPANGIELKEFPTKELAEEFVKAEELILSGYTDGLTD